ncbi:MAG: hypothetical protein Fur0018_26100 [Anaerolineales bacterium]
MNATQDLLTRLPLASLTIPLAADLLALLPDAAVLVHLHDGRILAANDAATSLTAHTHPELLRMNLANLLPEYPPLNASRRVLPTGQYLLHAGTQNRLVQVYVHRILSGLPWCVFILHRVVTSTNTTPMPRREWENRFPQAISQITQIVTGGKNPTYWEDLLKVIQPLTEARLLALYRTAPDTPHWECSASLPAESFLPPILPAATPTSSVWLRENVAQDPLHTLAAHNGYRYLTTAPIGDGVHAIGMLVAGDPERRLPQHLPHTLQTLGAFLYIMAHQTAWQDRLHAQVHTLEAQNTRHLNAIEHINTGLLYVSPTGRIEYMNPAAESMLGYALAEIQQRAVGDILIGAENLSLMLERATQGELIASLGNTTELHHRNGKPFPTRIQLIPLPTSNPPNPVLIILNDISERREFETRSQQLEQRAMLGEITSIFAHEVRNPINNISMGLQLLAASLPPDDQGQTHITRMLEDCNRLTVLMQSILQYSRVEDAPRQVLHLDELLQHMLERWKPRCIRQQVEIVLDIEADPPPILGHPASLERVFNNLFSNALRAMPHGGWLKIKIAPGKGRHDTGLVRVEVADTGIGIPEELQERIFAPFFTTDQKSGTGLGLAIVQRIITTHRGNIQVHSFPGAGTVFRLFFPAHKESA